MPHVYICPKLIIKSSYINYHLYADDTQFYVAFKANDVS